MGWDGRGWEGGGRRKVSRGEEIKNGIWKDWYAWKAGGEREGGYLMFPIPLPSPLSLPDQKWKIYLLVINTRRANRRTEGTDHVVETVIEIIYSPKQEMY